ncbi:MAG: sugar ABC transporter permease [Firmicutes bacterium HGW-Firmicutes-21]|nr:MAG: sugar ABC transporter permease [Firmicutes bacterium HGW-Firmicutes-21]
MDKAVKKKVKKAGDKPLTPKKQGKIRKAISLQKQKARMGWLFIAPFLIGFFLIYLPMIYESLVFSFNKIKIQGGGGYILEFVGWDNYRYALLDDPKFYQILVSSVKDLIFNIPAIVIFSLFMAVLLNQKMKGRAVFRAIFFIPVIVSTGIIESIDYQNAIAQAMEGVTSLNEGGMNTTDVGSQIISAVDVSRFFAGMKVGEGLVTYVTEMVQNVYGIINKSGVQMLIFLAGLQSISPAIYESCHIDGASSWETFWKITFPMISPMILVNTVYTVIDSFTSKSNTVMTYIAEIYGKTDGNVRATAMSWIYFLIVIIVLLVIGGIMSAYVFYQKRDT